MLNRIFFFDDTAPVFCSQDSQEHTIFKAGDENLSKHQILPPDEESGSWCHIDGAIIPDTHVEFSTARGNQYPDGCWHKLGSFLNIPQPKHFFCSVVNTESCSGVRKRTWGHHDTCQLIISDWNNTLIITEDRVEPCCTHVTLRWHYVSPYHNNVSCPRRISIFLLTVSSSSSLCINHRAQSQYDTQEKSH